MKPIVYVIVAVCAFLAFVSAVFFMPAAELLPAQVEAGSIAPGLSPVRSEGLMNFFKDIGTGLSKTFYGTEDLKGYAEGDPRGIGNKAPGELRAYAMWAVFLSLAMLFAAIALNAVGRYESEEKTILPVKK